MCDIGTEQKESNLYSNLKKGNKDMGFQDLKTIIDQFKKHFVLITFNSTEPLLYPHIVEAVKYVKKNRLHCKIATNGFLLPKLAKDLVEAELDYLVLSVDGPEKVHDEIRGVKGSYSRIVKGIKLVQKYKKNQKRPYIRINTTISEYNYDKLVEMVRELKNFKIKKFVLSHLNVITQKMVREHNKNISWYPTDLKSSISPQNIDIEMLYSQLKELRIKYGHLIEEDPKLNKIQLEMYYKYPNKTLDINNKCRIPWISTQILVNGDVIPNMRCINSIVLGNVFRQSFKSVWNSKKYRTFRRNLNKYRYFPACTRCCGTFPLPNIFDNFKKYQNVFKFKKLV